MGNGVTIILNILWVILGGFIMALGWIIAAALMALTIVGLPWVPAALRIAGFSLLPFGYRVEDRDDGALSFAGNVLWFILAGWWLAIGHLVFAVAFAVTIIGLPFAWAHLKLAGLSVAPVGKAIVPAW